MVKPSRGWGCANVVPGGSMGPFPHLNPEFVVRADPDVIMVGDQNFARLQLAQRPGWSGIRAVREKRLCRLYALPQSDVLVRPGPRMAEAAQHDGATA